MLEHFLDETWRYLVTITAAGVGGVIIAFLRRSWGVLKTIEAEFRPNGGSSLRDQIEQIKRHLLSSISYATARQWALIDGLGEPMFECDAQGYCIRANRAYLDLVGRSFDEVAGSGWELIIAEADRDAVWDAWVDAVERHRTFEGRYRIAAKDGGIFLVDAIATPIRDGDVVTGWLGKYRTVTRQEFVCVKCRFKSPEYCAGCRLGPKARKRGASATAG